MAFCGKCGIQVGEDVRFCPGCGAAMDYAPAQPASSPLQPQAAPGISQQNAPAGYDAKDIADNKFMAVLAYFGILVLIPWFAAPQSKFARFHAKQGITLLILDAAYIVLSIILNMIQITQTEYILGIPYEIKTTPWFISLLLFLISIPIAVLAIIGIINAAKGQVKKLPIIGKLSPIK